MASYSSIEWTDSTWNPVTGCTKVSPGCKNCYAEIFAERFRGVPRHPFEQGFDFKLWPNRLRLPVMWKESRMVFVNSMSDLFHEKVPDNFIKEVFNTMIEADHHIFQVLTKRSERMMEWIQEQFAKDIVPAHIWLGVSVENQDYVDRIKDLKDTPAYVRFVSCEPLLGPLKLISRDLDSIQWVIVGGESGHKARAMNPQWARDIKELCRDSDVAFFFKQWGTFNDLGERVGKKRAGRLLDGKMWDQMPKAEYFQKQQLEYV
ncbi:MAG: phage Gp37/Gp68 family protein [Candidatus Omnitrophota bacterium]|nr:phage Gp37/Gp68 family protein [Candidatus Omnitrophota bacterium]